MAEIREATEGEIAEFGFEPFGKSSVAAVWNEGNDVSHSRYKALKTQVTCLMDYRNTSSEYLCKLANDSAKIVSSRTSEFSDLVEAGITQLYIPVEESVIAPGRTGGKRAISFKKMMTLLKKLRDGSISEEEQAILDENPEEVASFNEMFA